MKPLSSVAVLGEAVHFDKYKQMLEGLKAQGIEVVELCDGELPKGYKAAIIEDKRFGVKTGPALDRLMSKQPAAPAMTPLQREQAEWNAKVEARKRK